MPAPPPRRGGRLGEGRAGPPRGCRGLSGAVSRAGPAAEPAVRPGQREGPRDPLSWAWTLLLGMGKGWSPGQRRAAPHGLGAVAAVPACLGAGAGAGTSPGGSRAGAGPGWAALRSDSGTGTAGDSGNTRPGLLRCPGARASLGKSRGKPKVHPLGSHIPLPAATQCRLHC